MVSFSTEVSNAQPTLPGPSVTCRAPGIFLVVLGAAALVPPPAEARPPLLTVPLELSVARCDGSPVKPRVWIEAQLRSANRVLAPHRIKLTLQPRSFAPTRCDLETRAHRNALARHLTGRAVVPVLLLRRIRDLDVRSYYLMGVHWRYSGRQQRHRKRRWVMLTARARPPVLAHELCHYFGLRHDPAGGNLMTPGPSSPLWRRPGKKPRPFAPLLTRRQARKLRRAVRRFLASARRKN